MTEHVPRHQLEALLADASHVPAGLRDHLASCEHCTARMQNIERARAVFALDHSASDFAQKVMAARRAAGPAQPTRLPWPPTLVYAWAAALGALAVAAVAWTLRDPAIRYRGAGVAMQAYVQRETGVRELHDGEVLSGGAQLAFTYSLSEPQHLLLFGIDDAGTITRYFPDGNIVQSSALQAGAKRQLPVGIELDARPGRERLIALFSAQPLDQDTAQAALESAWRELRARGKALAEPLELALPAKQITLWFEKR